MYSYRFLVCIALVGLLVGTVAQLDLAFSGAPTSRAAAQDGTTPLINLSGLRVPEGVRYSVSVAKPLGVVLRGLRVEVTLPAGAQLGEVFETPEYTQSLGRQGNTLS